MMFGEKRRYQRTTANAEKAHTTGSVSPGSATQCSASGSYGNRSTSATVRGPFGAISAHWHLGVGVSALVLVVRGGCVLRGATASGRDRDFVDIADRKDRAAEYAVPRQTSVGRVPPNRRRRTTQACGCEFDRHFAFPLFHGNLASLPMAGLTRTQSSFHDVASADELAEPWADLPRIDHPAGPCTWCA